MNPKPENPSRWETVVIAASFLMIWGWYLTRQSIIKTGAQPPLWLYVPLIAVLLSLVWVFVRRVRRVTNAMREQKITIGKPRPKR